MKYNFEYIELKYDLINCFLLEIDKSVLDISYSVDETDVNIQLVLLEGFTLSVNTTNGVKQRLVNYNVIITELYLTKEQFNAGKGEWQPSFYKWLDYLLFSKAEAL